mmetsp:Transcript_30830/g.37364  ORF Transcript_30830/g.37364 Transcript_30830/m.37364 type:complete len:243 (+) Transcript_30830:254-982(+)|eukprot:CAMPEP_0197852538 /NCGR_PEP_ID=MMETSP1438-20131217/20852_1 /TAXON_ID=1461541 /ORGANISM="Pterosperma sp., Strain CCMP1384" /LENGTH=242 /DNA_ID=CAMNT_0043466633 /DNA_START=241 /DNA_END=969 /DNA_ORIENTATION=-
MKPMLIESAAHGEAGKLGRWGLDDNIDALPYADNLPAGWRQKVDILVQEEMRRMPKSRADYLKELPPVPTSRFQEGSVIANELQRVAEGKPVEPLDTTRYRLEPPPLNRRNDPGAWKHGLTNAQAQLEHQALRMTNLELAVKYGPNAWRANLQHLDATCSSAKQALADTKAEIEQINRERKLHQTSVGTELSSLDEQWMELVKKNMEIDQACALVAQEIEKMGGGKKASEGDTEMHDEKPVA